MLNNVKWSSLDTGKTYDYTMCNEIYGFGTVMSPWFNIFPSKSTKTACKMYWVSIFKALK